MRNGGPGALSAEERALLQRMRSSFGGQGGSRGQSGSGGQTTDALFGGSYIVFALRNGQPQPVNVRTGLTDLDYSEVRAGLTAADTVLILPSASLVAAQEESRERMSRMNQGLPGVQQQGSAATGTSGPRGR
jgi:hypothetical protein